MQFFFGSWVVYSLLALVAAGDESPVTCGSMVKLQHVGSSSHLHSHQIQWGSGSGQQSVTGHGSNNDAGANWLVKSAHGKDASCEVGTPLKCGSVIRLEHINTGKNLHSHLFKAALSGQQEVSGFGDHGQGDTGDDWVVQCAGKASSGSKYWMRGESIELKHKDTNKYLYTSNRVTFTASNCGQSCPIMGQMEVSTSGTKQGGDTKWKTAQGLFFPSKTGEGIVHSDELGEDDEL